MKNRGVVMKAERVYFNGFLESVETTARVCTDTNNNGRIEFAKKMWEMGHCTPFEHNTFRLRVKGKIQKAIEACEAIGIYQPGLRILPDGFIGGSFRSLSRLDAFKLDSFNEIVDHLEWVDTSSEDARITFKVETNIGVARQLLRHREFSFTERSTRYVKKFEIDETPSSVSQEVKVLGLQCIEDYDYLRSINATRDEARESLPLCTATTFYMTGWRSSYSHFINLRTDSHAHKGAQIIAEEIARSV